MRQIIVLAVILMAASFQGTAFATDDAKICLDEKGPATERRDACTRVIDQANAQKEENWRYFFARGLTYHKLKQLDNAVNDLKKAKQLNPSSAEPPVALADIWYDRQDYRKMLQEADDAIKANPSLPLAHTWQGTGYFGLKMYDRAILASTHAITLDRDHLDAYVLRGQVYHVTGKLDLALQDLNDAIKGGINEADVFHEKGLVLGKMNQMQAAIEAFTIVLKMQPNRSSAYSDRGNAYRAEKQLKLALSDLNKAIELNPKNSSAFFNRGHVHSLMSENDKAFADYAMAITINPKDHQAYLSRGVLHKQHNRPDQALDDYNKAIAIKPDYVDALYNRSLIYFSRQQYDLVVADLERLILVAPTDKDVWEGKAKALEKLGRKAEAISAFRMLLKLDPKDKEGIDGLKRLGTNP